VVLAHRANGSTDVALSAEQLAELGGSVEGFARALQGTTGIQPDHARIG